MERKLAAILAADVVGYSRLMGEDEAGTLTALKAHRAEFIDPMIAEHRGRIVKLMGDGVLIEFASVVDALTCAVAIQRGMGERNAEVPEGRRIAFRIGINLGDIIVDGDDIYGNGVNVAARLETLAEPGGICLSGRVLDQVEKNVDVGFASLGPQTVKNIEKPVNAYKVLLDPADAGKITEVAEPRPRHGTKWVVAAAILALVVGAGTAAWLYLNEPEDMLTATATTPPPLPDKPSVAVLPFANLSADPTQEYFTDGLTDDLILDLSKVSGLFVIARNSMFTFKGKAVRIKDVAEELGVRYVVEGSVRRIGDRVRVNAQLVEGDTGHHVWAERYDREVTDLFAVQDELVGRIVSALAVRLTKTEQKQLAARPAPEFEAYDLYLQARDSYFSGDESRMRDSLDLYQRAWTIDPTFARAYAGYARTAADILRLGLSRVMSVPLARKAAEDAASRALALDPAQPDAHSVLALLRLADGDRDAALRFAQRAVELDPNNADAQATMAIVLGYAGEPEAALEAIRTAVRLNPRPPPYFWTYYGWALFLNRDYDDAIAVLEPVAETPGQAAADSPREILAMAYAESGRIDEARAQVDAARERDPFLNLAYYRQRYGLQARTEDVHRRIDALRKAGMPEWPLGFRGEPKDRLKGRALQDLISGKTWSGSDATRRLPFVEEFGKDGDVVYAAAATLMIGTASIKDGELCERFDLFLLGQEGCGPVYRNPDGTSEDRNEYIYVNPTTVRHFSLAE
jgi:adenylate cyclase